MEKLKSKFIDIWHEYKLLVLGLTIPLFALSVFFLFLARPISMSDILLNIATDFITIIITIWYVNWILKGNEEIRWKGTHKFIISLAGGIAHRVISEIAEKSGFFNEIYPRNNPPLYTRTISDIQQEILVNVMKFDRDNLISHLDKLSKMQWRILFQSLASFPSEISTFIGQFGPRLNPSELEAVLSLRNDIVSVISVYDLFSDFLGQPVESMPEVKDGRPWDFAIFATIRSGIELQIILQRAVTVINVYNYKAGQSDIDWNIEVAKSRTKYQKISRYKE